jgi:hypothetical protein
MLGVNLSNRQWEQHQLTDDDKAKLLMMLPNLDTVKLFSYHRLDVWYWIRDYVKPKRYVVRLNHEDDWELLSKVYEAGFRHVAIELGNEPNHPNEPWSGDVGKFRLWYSRQAAICKLRTPDWKIVFPGLSPMYGSNIWYQEFKVEIGRADYVGVHAYYQELLDVAIGDVLNVVGLFPGKEFICTEFCCTSGEAGNPKTWDQKFDNYLKFINWVIKAKPEVKGVCIFMLGSDDQHWHNVAEVIEPQLAQALGQASLARGSIDVYVNEEPPILGGQQESGRGYSMDELEQLGIKKFQLAGMELLDIRHLIPDQPGRMQPISFTKKNFIVIHHTATGVPTTLKGAVEFAKVIYKDHINRGWGGIGYNVLVVGPWALLVGDFNTERAHTGQLPHDSANYQGIAVAIAGNFSSNDPDEATLAVVKKVVSNIQHAYGAWLPVVPHLLFNCNSQYDTICPGPGWKRWWGKILRGVGE